MYFSSPHPPFSHLSTTTCVYDNLTTNSSLLYNPPYHPRRPTSSRIFLSPLLLHISQPPVARRITEKSVSISISVSVSTSTSVSVSVSLCLFVCDHAYESFTYINPFLFIAVCISFHQYPLLSTQDLGLRTQDSLAVRYIVYTDTRVFCEFCIYETGLHTE